MSKRKDRDDLAIKITEVLAKKKDLHEDLYSKSLEELVEELKIYQEELEFQNDELRNTQQRLEQSELKFQSLFEHSPVPFLVVDDDFRIEYVNKKARNLFEEADDELFNLDLRKHVAPQDQDRLHLAWNQLSSGKKTTMNLGEIQIENRFYDLKANYNSPSTEQILISLDDVTRNVKLREELEFQAGLLNKIDQAVMVIDKNRAVQYWNNHAAQLYGFERNEALGSNIDELLVQTQSLENSSQPSDTSVNEKGKYVKRFILTKKGTEICAKTIDYPLINEAGHANGLIRISEDYSLEYSLEVEKEEIAFFQDEIYSNMSRLLHPDQEISEQFLGEILMRSVKLLQSKEVGFLWLGEEQTEWFCPNQNKVSKSIVTIDFEKQEWFQKLQSKDSYKQFFTENSLDKEDRMQFSGLTYFFALRTSKTLRGIVVATNLTGPLSDSFQEAIELLASRLSGTMESKFFQERLRLSEAKNRAVIDALPDMMFIVNANQEIVDYKANKPDLYVNENQVIGSVLREVFPDELYNAINGNISKAQEKGYSRVEYSMNTINNGFQYFEVRSTKMDEFNTVSLVRNTTESIIAQQQLLLFKKAVEQSPASIIITDLNGSIEYVNGQFEKATGYTKEEVKGKNPRILKTGYTTKEEYQELWEKVLNGQTWRGEFLNQRKDSTTYWEYASIVPIQNEKDELVKIMAIKEDISELKQINFELKRLSNVASRISNYVIITDAAGKIEFVNKAFEKDIGYKLNEIKGLKPGDFLQGERTSEKDVEFMRQGLAKKEPFTAQVLNYTKSGKPYWLEIDYSFVWDDKGEITQIISIQRDITDLVEARQAVIKERNLLKTLIDHLPSLIHIKDTNFKRTLANQMKLDFFGFKEESEIIGKTDYDLYPKELADSLRKDDEQILKTGEAILNKEVQLTSNYGNTGWFLNSKVPLFNGQGEVQRIIGINKDISSLKKRETELEKTVSIVSQQNKQLLSFTYIVSHNLRSHAANISSLLEMLDGEENADLRASYNDMLHKTANNLMETLNNLNTVVRIQQNTGVEKNEFSLQEVIDEAKNVLAIEIKEAQIEIEEDIQKNARVNFNYAYMESIVLNLMSNAIKYKDPEKSQAKLRISYRTEGEQHELVFEDNGLGMDLELYGKRLFGMYQTFHKHPKAKGLGLFITKSQVEAMGGEISVESTQGKGTKFTVRW